MATRQHAKRHNDASKLLMFFGYSEPNGQIKAKRQSLLQRRCWQPVATLAIAWQGCIVRGRATMIKGKRGQREEKKGSKGTKKEVEWTNTRRNKRPTKKQQEKNKGPEKIKTEERAKEENTQHNQLSKRPVGFLS